MNAFRLALILPVIGLAACTDAEMTTRKPADTATTTTAATVTQTAATAAPAPRPAARATAAQLDTTSAAQRAEAARPATAAETKLGTTIASLGDPTQPGFWIKTPLVTAQASGRIVNPATGKSAKVDLLPLSGGGSGSQVSLPALQLLGASLTDLPVIEVFRGS